MDRFIECFDTMALNSMIKAATERIFLSITNIHEEIAYEIIEELEKISNQVVFVSMIMNLGRSLVSEWGSTNEDGNPTKMNHGVAMKIINLIVKHFAFSRFMRNDQVKHFLHIPWDKYTLSPVRFLYNEMSPRERMPSKPSMGFVSNIRCYKRLHDMISEICYEAKMPRINYEFYVWDMDH